MQIIAPDAGEILFDGEAVGSCALDLTRYRREVQMVFQDSYASLNPRLTAEDTDRLRSASASGTAARQSARAHDLLHRVGLEPARFAGRYPHELSGGQRQRVNIARALALRAAPADPRRGGVGARQVDRGAGAQPAARPQGRIRPDLHVHLARPQRRAFHVRPGDGHVSRQGRRARAVRCDLCTTRAIPIRRRCSPRCRRIDPDRRTKEAPLSGDPPNPIDPPPRLPLPYALQICRTDYVRTVRAAAHDRGRRRHSVACHMATAGLQASAHAVRPHERPCGGGRDAVEARSSMCSGLTVDFAGGRQAAARRRRRRSRARPGRGAGAARRIRARARA